MALLKNEKRARSDCVVTRNAKTRLRSLPYALRSKEERASDHILLSKRVRITQIGLPQTYTNSMSNVKVTILKFFVVVGGSTLCRPTD